MSLSCHKHVLEWIQTRFDTSNYESECDSIDRPLPKGKVKKVIGLMKDELGGNIMTKFVVLGGKTYSYLIDDGSEDKKAGFWLSHSLSSFFAWNNIFKTI